MSVVVEVEETRRDMPTATSDACFGGYIREGAVAIVVVERVLAVVGDEQVGIAIVVVVTDRHAHSVVARSCAGESGGLGDVGEAAILVLAIEAVPVTRIGPVEILGRFRRVGYATTVDQEDVEQTIVVVIEEGYAAGHGLDEIFLRGRRIQEGEIQTA